MKIYNYKDLQVNCVLNKKLKHTYISINAHAEVILKSSSLNSFHIEHILKEKEIWIRKALSKQEKKEFLSCEKLSKKELAETKLYLKNQIEYFSKLMNLSYNQLKFRKMKSRWGSCSSTKNITLNTNLIKLPKPLIDYVIVHELTHLVHMNHSKKFHTHVQNYLPNSKELIEELKNIAIA